MKCGGEAQALQCDVASKEEGSLSAFYNVSACSYTIVVCYIKWIGGWSAKKFRKLQMRKFADLHLMLYLRAFRKCDTLQICDFRDHFLGDLWT
jgi:hypothetical protein